MKKILVMILMIGILSVGSSVFAKSLDDYTLEIADLNYQKKYQEALKLVNIALSGYPNSSELYCLRGQIYDDMNNKKAALTDFDKALSLDPKNEDAYFYRGMVKIDLGSFQGAYIDFTTCLRVNPKSGYCYFGRGTARMELGDLGGSMKDVEYGMELMDEEHKRSIEEADETLKEVDDFMNKIHQRENENRAK